MSECINIPTHYRHHETACQNESEKQRNIGRITEKTLNESFENRSKKWGEMSKNL